MLYGRCPECAELITELTAQRQTLMALTNNYIDEAATHLAQFAQDFMQTPITREEFFNYLSNAENVNTTDLFNPRIKEAINWAMLRDHVIDAIHKAGATVNNYGLRMHQIDTLIASLTTDALDIEQARLLRKQLSQVIDWGQKGGDLMHLTEKTTNAMEYIDDFSPELRTAAKAKTLGIGGTGKVAGVGLQAFFAYFTYKNSKQLGMSEKQAVTTAGLSFVPDLGLSAQLMKVGQMYKNWENAQVQKCT